jgi:hypothetical protein
MCYVHVRTGVNSSQYGIAQQNGNLSYEAVFPQLSVALRRFLHDLKALTRKRRPPAGIIICTEGSPHRIQQDVHLLTARINGTYCVDRLSRPARRCCS